MPLTPGTTLGPYQIDAPLGAGGMGEVYQATDTRLDRTIVACLLKLMTGPFRDLLSCNGTRRPQETSVCVLIGCPGEDLEQIGVRRCAEGERARAVAVPWAGALQDFLRYPDHDAVRVELDDTAKLSQQERVRVPTMMVQTLVENAVKHGVAAVRGPGRIEIDARQHDDRLQVVVVDNGPGFTDEDDAGLQKRTGQSGYGLRNVRERLHGYFGDRATLVAERDQDRRVTRVSITMPLAPVGQVVSAGDPETSAAPAGGAR